MIGVGDFNAQVLSRERPANWRLICCPSWSYNSGRATQTLSGWRKQFPRKTTPGHLVFRFASAAFEPDRPRCHQSPVAWFNRLLSVIWVYTGGFPSLPGPCSRLSASSPWYHLKKSLIMMDNHQHNFQLEPSTRFLSLRKFDDLTEHWEQIDVLKATVDVTLSPRPRINISRFVGYRQDRLECHIRDMHTLRRQPIRSMRSDTKRWWGVENAVT